MLPAPSIYPRFAANQLLTESSLNQMVDYFDGQVRDTRIYLNGLGIYYGLALELGDEVDGKCTLTVQKGAGVSSEGFLFKLENDCTFKGYLNEVTILKEKLWKPGCPSEGFDDEYIVQELTEETADDVTNPALTKDILRDKVVMFLCEFDESTTANGKERCFNELDEKGISKSTVLRMLLFEKSDVEKFAKSITGINTGRGDRLPKLYAPRFGYTNTPEPSIRLSIIENLFAYTSNYKNIIDFGKMTTTASGAIVYSSIVDSIAEAYVKAGDLFFKLFAENENVFRDFKSDLTKLRRRIFPTNENDKVLDIQCFHDYLKDLILAYEEFACLDIVQQTSLFPDTCDFPKYLLLGIPNPSLNADGTPSVTPKDFRTNLQRPPIEDIGAASVDDVRMLFDRMKKMANIDSNVFLPNKNQDTETRITPSQGINRPLSERAIPFYLSSEVMRPCWSPRLSSLEKTDEIPSYEPANQNAPYGYPLLYDMNKYDFFRVEGHMGKKLNIAQAEIERQREKWNIPFSIQCVQLNVGNDVVDPDKISLEFDDMQRIYTKVRADIQCVAKSPNFEKREKLLDENQFPKEFKDFDLVAFEPIYNEAMNANPSVIDCNLEVLKELDAENNELKADLERMVWFHEFALKHPGLEHLGGVYKGGTLVLVFIKSFNGRANTVIADFCLPYNCCSNAPSIVYHLSKVEPKILMRQLFCSNEDGDFMVRATPEGGQLSGIGIVGNRFSPLVAATDPNVTFTDNKAEVVVKYELDDGLFAEVIVVIEKAPLVFIGVESPSAEYNGDCQFVSRTFKFVDKEQQSDSYFWEWDDKTSEEDEISITFDIDNFESKEIRLTGTRGICKTTHIFEFSPCPFEHEITVDFDGVDPSVPIDNTVITEIKLKLGIVGGTLRLFSLDAVDEILEEFSEFLNKDNDCENRDFILNIANLPPQDLTPGKPTVFGKYQLRYELDGCDLSNSVDFTIAIPSGDDSGRGGGTGGGGGEVVNPQMPRSRAATKPQTKAASKSSAKSSTKSTSKTKGAASSKTTSKVVSGKAKPTAKKKTTTTSATKKKASPPKKDTPTPKLEKLQNGARIMNLRRTAQQAVLKKLEDENKLKGKSFGLAMSAFLFPGNDLERLNQRFEEAMKSLLASVKRSKTELKLDWIKLVEVLLHNYLDKRVALTPTSLDEVTIDLLKAQIGKMKELKLKIKTMQKNWKGEELETALKASIIKKINSLF